jgi:hypothetical protein
MIWNAMVMIATKVRGSGWVHAGSLVVVLVDVFKTWNVMASTAAIGERGSSGIQVECVPLWATMCMTTVDCSSGLWRHAQTLEATQQLTTFVWSSGMERRHITTIPLGKWLNIYL